MSELPVTSQDSQSGNSGNNTLFILSGIAGGIIVLFLVYILASYLLSASAKNTPIYDQIPSRNQTQMQPQFQSQSQASVDPKYKEVLTRTTLLDRKGKYSAVAKELNSYIESNPPEKEKLNASLKLASAYYNAKDYDTAISIYEKLGQESPDYKVASLQGLADTYRAKGNKQKAIEYLNQAITVLKADKQPGSDLQIASDEQAIRILKK